MEREVERLKDKVGSEPNSRKPMKRLLPTTMLLIAALFSTGGQAADEQATRKKTATSGELFDAIARAEF
jgi:hypothetical protein